MPTNEEYEKMIKFAIENLEKIIENMKEEQRELIEENKQLKEICEKKNHNINNAEIKDNSRKWWRIMFFILIGSQLYLQNDKNDD